MHFSLFSTLIYYSVKLSNRSIVNCNEYSLNIERSDIMKGNSNGILHVKGLEHLEPLKQPIL